MGELAACENVCHMQTLAPMEISELRKELGLSLRAFAEKIGLKSGGQVHQLENGHAKASVPVALAIERLSGGRIAADGLNGDVALVRNSGSEHAA